MIAVTDYCATLPLQICRILERDPRLKVLPSPAELGTFPVELARMCDIETIPRTSG